jgi:hypothetical protein
MIMLSRTDSRRTITLSRIDWRCLAHARARASEREGDAGALEYLKDAND